MPRRLTLEDLEEEVRWQADIERANQRHTPADLRKLINRSIYKYRELLCNEGDSYFMQASSGELPVGPATDPDDPDVDYAFGVLDITSLSPRALVIYGIEVEIHGFRQNLTKITFKQRNHLHWWTGQNTGNYYPLQFFVYNQTKVAIVPPSNSNYKYTLWYLPELPELEGDKDEFDAGVPGGEQWVVWDVVCKVHDRDNNPGLLRQAQIERDREEDSIVDRSTSLTKAGPLRRVNTRARRKINRQYALYPWDSDT